MRFDWIPTVGGRIREIRGADPFHGPPLSGQYDWEYRRKDAEAWANYYGVPYREPQSVEFDAKLLGIASAASKRLENVRDYSVALASEVFARGSWPIDRALCVRIAESTGLDPDEFERLIDSPESLEEIESTCQTAVELGVFGNPTFFVGDAMFWGQDRLTLVSHALKQLKSTSA